MGFRSKDLKDLQKEPYSVFRIHISEYRRMSDLLLQGTKTQKEDS